MTAVGWRRPLRRLGSRCRLFGPPGRDHVHRRLERLPDLVYASVRRPILQRAAGRRWAAWRLLHVAGHLVAADRCFSYTVPENRTPDGDHLPIDERPAVEAGHS